MNSSVYSAKNTALCIMRIESYSVVKILIAFFYLHRKCANGSKKVQPANYKL